MSDLLSMMKKFLFPFCPINYPWSLTSKLHFLFVCSAKNYYPWLKCLLDVLVSGQELFVAFPVYELRLLSALSYSGHKVVLTRLKRSSIAAISVFICLFALFKTAVN